MFSSPKLIKSAVKCGLSFAYMSLHGDREVHNELTRGDFFDQTVSGIRNASRAVPNGTVVNCVVNRMNLERLRDVADICRDLGCRTVKFSNLTMEGAAIENSARLAVSLEKSVTAVTDAMNYAISLGMDARFDGFPLCMMGKLRKSLDNLRTNGITHMSESFETELYPTDCGNYSRSGDACMTCAVEECCGIDKKYSSFFGKPKLMPLGLV
jgi:MoaA/NifB/PqqE/SkfB family radical SAM enzyme